MNARTSVLSYYCTCVLKKLQSVEKQKAPPEGDSSGGAKGKSTMHIVPDAAQTATPPRDFSEWLRDAGDHCQRSLAKHRALAAELALQAAAAEARRESTVGVDAEFSEACTRIARLENLLGLLEPLIGEFYAGKELDPADPRVKALEEWFAAVDEWAGQAI